MKALSVDTECKVRNFSVQKTVNSQLIAINTTATCNMYILYLATCALCKL